MHVGGRVLGSRSILMKMRGVKDSALHWKKYYPHGEERGVRKEE